MARQKRAGAVYGFLARLPGKWVSLTVDRQTGELVNALIYTE